MLEYWSRIEKVIDSTVSPPPLDRRNERKREKERIYASSGFSGIYLGFQVVTNTLY